MASILLDSTDMSSFSASTRAEILACLDRTISGRAASPAAAPSDTQGNDYDDSVSDLSALTPNAMKTFMAGVSDRTNSILKAFAETSDGVLSMREVMRVGGYSEWQDTRGFQSGLTKRIRTVTNDSDAWFFGWRSADEEMNGDFFIHPVTHKSLQTYFKI